MTHVTIIGGGSLGTVCAAVLGSHADVELTICTQHPDRWGRTVEAVDPEGKVYRAELSSITSDAEQAVSMADIVLLTLPGYLIREHLSRIQPYLRSETVVGSIVSSTGFFFFAHDILGSEAKLFGFQRVPFIARLEEYGRRGLLLGYKPQLYVAMENIEKPDDFAALLARLFATKVVALESFYEAALTNSNPILHTGRLYSMWHDYQGDARKECGLFYKEWDNASSEMIIRMDEEFQQLLRQLPVREGIIPSLLSYYESEDAAALTRKLQSIKAFGGIVSPMRETEEGWVPDYESRYFTEDFPYGLRFVYELAKEYKIPTPTIDKVYTWGMKIVNCTL